MARSFNSSVDSIFASDVTDGQIGVIHDNSPVQIRKSNPGNLIRSPESLRSTVS
jgi:hypothetical protein